VRAARSTTCRNSAGAALRLALVVASLLGLAACENFVLHGSGGSEHGIERMKAGVRF